MLLRRFVSSKRSYPIPIVSVGNLTVGGSGKTPFVIALALCLDGVCIISRGYGRESRGLVEVSDRGKILTDVYRSGDEPMLMANSLPKASVIVSEDRHAAIALAIQRGAKVIILDDGFNRGEIQKFEILLSPEAVRNPFPFPAGPFREWYGMKKYADLHLTENQDFERHVEIVDSTERMLLVTAISNPERLDRFLPEGVVARLYLEDHAYFDEIDLRERMVGANATSLLVTQKDQVKMEGFKLPLSVMQLKLQIKSEVFDQVDAYVSNHSRGS